MTRSRYFVPIMLIVFAAVSAVGVVGYAMYLHQGRTETRLLAQSKPLPSFELTAHTGETVSLESLQGQWWVVDFALTRCHGVCPVLVRRMGELQTMIRSDRVLAGVKLITIAVDPDHDTPQVLAEYAAKHNVDPSIWRYLTGERAAIWPLVQNGFGLAVSFSEDAEEAGTPVQHSGKLVLVDPQGHIRGYYSGMIPEELAILRADLKRLR